MNNEQSRDDFEHLEIDGPALLGLGGAYHELPAVRALLEHSLLVEGVGEVGPHPQVAPTLIHLNVSHVKKATEAGAVGVAVVDGPLP